MSLHMCFVGHESTLQLYAPPPEHIRKLRLDPDHRTMVISLEQEH